MIVRLLLVAAVFALAGCPGGAPPPIDPVVFERLLEAAIAAALIADLRKLKRGQDRREPTHRAFFVARRLTAIHGERPALFDPTQQTTLLERLRGELTQIDAFLEAELGKKRTTGPLVPVRGGTGDVVPHHLDLADVARVRVSDAPGDALVRTRARQFTADRVQRVVDIVWRAAALQPALWTPSSDGHTAALVGDDLRELLDRRLHIVERMNRNVSEVNALLGGPPAWKLTGVHGPWKDGTRVRIVEYPRVASFFAGTIGAVNISIFGEWVLSTSGKRLEYHRLTVHGNASPSAAWRMPAEVEPHWDPQADGENYGIVLAPKSGVSPAAVIDQMFDYAAPAKQDFWHRAWIWCDHAIALLHLEALLFARRRRSAGADAEFGKLVSDGVAGGKKPYVMLVDVLGKSGAANQGHLLSDAHDPHFENTVVDVGDLQVGDQLVFWNSAVYNHITSGDWALENALVMDVGSSVALSARPTSGIDLDTLRLQGHGTAVRGLGAYRELIVDHVRDALVTAQERIVAEVKNNPGAASALVGSNALIRWSPYETLTAAELAPALGRTVVQVGAWWVQIPFKDFGSVAAALQAIPKSITRPAARGAGYVDAPGQAFDKNVLFPIFEPKFPSKGKRSAWDAYLEARAAGPVPAPRLRAVEVDASIAPGLHAAGETKPIPIVRPRVKR